MTEYNCSERLAIVLKFSYNYDNSNIKKYKVADVKLTTSLIERIFKLGTIVCYTGDVTNPELKLVHVKHSREIKSYLLKQSEAARLKRRTLNTVDIGAHGADMADLDHDGIPDSME